MICVIDYGMGNLRSVSKALEKMGGEVVVSPQPSDLNRADKMVLPGVGAFGDACRELQRRKLFEAVRNFILKKKPFLGICLGLQLLFEESEESPGQSGLGIFRGKVRKFKSANVKIPHMGWNQMTLQQKDTPLLKNVSDESFFYFVHSFYAVPEDSSLVAGECGYGREKFAAFLGEGKTWASQFHPEKSQEAGLQIFRNFVNL